MIQPRIETLEPKKLVGMKIHMSAIDNKTGELWRSFGPRITEIQHRVGEDKYSLQVYDKNYFKQFSSSNTYEKWALVEVSNFEQVPDELERFNLAGGLYAVFDYKGSSADSSIFQTIYGSWLPASGYQLDHRPHFEVLGENYKNNDPDSEEEIWIPLAAPSD